MAYFAITQGTADWLQAKTAVIDGLQHFLLGLAAHIKDLEQFEFAEGPIRVTASKDRHVVAFWNTDYLSGTGDESWAFLRIDSDRGLLGEPEILKEVLERCTYVINQRLQGLLLDGAYIHRSHDDGGHTILAGRGRKRAKRYSMGYFEGPVGGKGSTRTCMLFVGPMNDPKFTTLSSFAVSESARLPMLFATANTLAFAQPGKPVAKPILLQDLRERLAPYTRTQLANVSTPIEVMTAAGTLKTQPYRVQGLTYDDWIAADSPLTDVQRRILNSDVLEKHPLRIVGPGGSGKTLLMQLLVSRVLRSAQDANRPCRVLYVVHNDAMREKVRERFRVLLDSELPDSEDAQTLDVSTLSDYGRGQLDLEVTAVINTDATESKKFQFEQIMESLNDCLSTRSALVKGSKLLENVAGNAELRSVFAILLMVEISVAIKGRGLAPDDRKKYIESQRNFSRLHGVLNAKEREFVYDVFSEYYRRVFEMYQVLDTDDVALSLLGRLRTPLWELKRKVFGYDYIFVDETQLFNENERRVLPLLTKGTTNYVPIALALDEAQQVYGQTTAGLATLGIENITSESLPSIHRSTRAIAQLAFFVIQRCTELFSAEFPNFTHITEKMPADTHPLARPPRYENAPPRTDVYAHAVDTVQRLRRDNLRQIAVVCHAEQYWDGLESALQAARLPLYIVEQRGEKLPSEQPVVVLARPQQIGGQEFDAVVLVGLEQGVAPPSAVGNDALGAAIEQQLLREIYLSITRARYVLLVLLSHRAALTAVLRDAVKVGLLQNSLH